MLARRGYTRGAATADHPTAKRAPAKSEPVAGGEAGRRPPTRSYLLFAGSDAVPRGGLSDLVGAFTSEVTARHAFRDIRRNESSQKSWAQLAVVDDDRGIRTLSWFGIGAAPSRKLLPYAEKVTRHPQLEGGVMEAGTLERLAEAGRVEPIAPRRRSKRIAVAVIGLALVGVAASVQSDGTDRRPVAPTHVTVGAGGPAGAPIIPFVTDPSVVVEGIRGVDG
jgi:hypothetical protein